MENKTRQPPLSFSGLLMCSTFLITQSRTLPHSSLKNQVNVVQVPSKEQLPKENLIFSSNPKGYFPSSSGPSIGEPHELPSSAVQVPSIEQLPKENQIFSPSPKGDLPASSGPSIGEPHKLPSTVQVPSKEQLSKENRILWPNPKGDFHPPSGPSRGPHEPPSAPTV